MKQLLMVRAAAVHLLAGREAPSRAAVIRRLSTCPKEALALLQEARLE